MWLDHNQLSALPEGLFAGLSRLQAAQTSRGLWLWRLNCWQPAQCTSRWTLCWSLESSSFGSEQQSPQCTSRVDSLLVSRGSRKWGCTTTSSVLFPKDSLLVWRLQVLALHNNSLSALPEGLFAGLWSLQVLALNDNHLSALPEWTLCWSLESSSFGSEQQSRQCTSQWTLCWSLEAPGSGAAQQPAQRTSRRTLFWSLESAESVGSAATTSSVHFPEGLFAGLSSLQKVWPHNNSLKEGSG